MTVAAFLDCAVVGGGPPLAATAAAAVEVASAASVVSAARCAERRPAAAAVPRGCRVRGAPRGPLVGRQTARALPPPAVGAGVERATSLRMRAEARDATPSTQYLTPGQWCADAADGRAASPLPSSMPDEFWFACLDGHVDADAINYMVWHCLGYWYDGGARRWRDDAVPRAFREAYPIDERAPAGWSPPDFIGVPGEYAPESDRPVKRAVQLLQRSVPAKRKQMLKRRLGFAGYKTGELTPDKTRRAQCVNFILSTMEPGES